MHYIYILQCTDNSYYVGYTTDVQKRLKEHNQGGGGHNTKIKRPVTLLYDEKFNNKYDALRRESQIKRWSRAKKKALIDGNIEILKKLSRSMNSRRSKQRKCAAP